MGLTNSQLQRNEHPATENSKEVELGPVVTSPKEGTVVIGRGRDAEGGPVVLRDRQWWQW